jgi:hypothetical protein
LVPTVYPIKNSFIAIPKFPLKKSILTSLGEIGYNGRYPKRELAKARFSLGFLEL